MRNIVLVCIVATLSSGCMTGGSMAKVIKELKNDPATVNVRIVSIYGTINFTRASPGSNTVDHAITPDGTVTVGKKP